MSAFDPKRTSVSLRHGKVVRLTAWLPVLSRLIAATGRGAGLTTLSDSKDGEENFAAFGNLAVSSSIRGRF
jgi:hypothetical protein